MKNGNWKKIVSVLMIALMFVAALPAAGATASGGDDARSIPSLGPCVTVDLGQPLPGVKVDPEGCEQLIWDLITGS